MTGLRHTLVAVLSLLGAALPTAVANRQETIAQQKKDVLELLKNKTLLDAHRIEDVFAIRREGPDLILHALMPPTRYYDERRAEIDGLAFPATVLCRELSKDIPQVEFEFTLDDWTIPLVHGVLHVHSGPSELVIEKAWNTPNGDSRLVYNWDGSSVTMNVLGGDALALPMSRLRADNFEALRREHPLEVEQYLRPLLREMRQEAALVPEPAAAWQVLMNDWPVGQSEEAEVRRCLPALDDDNFRVRAKAASELYRLGRGASAYIRRMDRRGLSVEQKVRLDEVVARYKCLPDFAAEKLRDDPHFLVDCLDCEDPIARRLALARLQKIMGPSILFDINLDPTARISAVNRLRDMLFPPKLPMAKWSAGQTRK